MTVVSVLEYVYKNEGAQKVISDEQKVRKTMSETDRQANADTGKTTRWYDRHKTALKGIAAAMLGAAGTILALSPDVQFALGETYFWFSLLAYEIGEDVSPAFDALSGFVEDLYNGYMMLPEPLQEVVSWSVLLGAALSAAAIGVLWLYGSLTGTGLAGGLTAIGASGAAGALGVMLLTYGMAILVGAIIGGAVVWGMYKYGVMDALATAGAHLSRFNHNFNIIFGNMLSHLGAWGTHAVAIATLTGLEFAVGFMDPLKGIPFLGDIVGPKLDSLTERLVTARANTDAEWQEYQDNFAGFSAGIRIDDIGPKTAKTPMDMATLLLEQNDLYNKALEDMVSGNATATSDIELATSGMSDSVTTDYQAMSDLADGWGKDLMANYTAGLKAGEPELDAELARIKAKIDSAMSYDIPANDRQASKWGSDLVKHFSAGMRSATTAGSSHTSVSFGDFSVTGARAQSFDQRAMISMIKTEVANAVRIR